MNFQTLTIGVSLASAVSALAYRGGALSATGAVAAAGVGTCAMAAGWSWGVVLIAYFVSATALSRFRAADKESVTEGRVEKGSRRDAVQVLANGGVFAFAALGYGFSPDPIWQGLGGGALAASAADTWATEIGTLARAAPRSIVTWRRVDPGTSGGVTAQGFLASVAGAGLVAGIVWLARWPNSVVVAALIGGIVGCVLDSLAGASLQARRWCASCRTFTEQRTHRCGTVTTIAGGIAWLDNDGVNVISTIGGALVGAAGARYF